MYDVDVIESPSESPILLLFVPGVGDVVNGETVDVVGVLPLSTTGDVVVDGTSLGTSDTSTDGIVEATVNGTIDGEAVGVDLYDVGETVLIGGILELLSLLSSPIPFTSIVA